MGIIGSHLDLTSVSQGHQANGASVEATLPGSVGYRLQLRLSAKGPAISVGYGILGTRAPRN